MTYSEARAWIVYASFGCCLLLIAFFLVAPAFGYRLDSALNQPLKAIQIVLPTFIGYLASAATYVFDAANRPAAGPEQKVPLLGAVVAIPFIIFALGTTLLLIVFNSGQLGFDYLTGWLSLLLGLVTALTGVAVQKLFKPAETQADPSAGTRL